jgi:predicted small lipoprotein YifL
MKKLIAFLLAATMLIGLAACGDKPVETTPNTTTAEDTGVQTTETTTPQATEPTTPEPTTEVTTPAETTTEKPVTPSVDPTKIFNEDKIVLSFAALSDTQHKYSGMDTLGKFKTALRQLVAYADKTGDDLDAVFFAGDLVQSAKTQEVK